GWGESPGDNRGPGAPADTARFRGGTAWPQMWSHPRPAGTVHSRPPATHPDRSRTAAATGERRSALLESTLGATPRGLPRVRCLEVGRKPPAGAPFAGTGGRGRHAGASYGSTHTAVVSAWCVARSGPNIYLGRLS